MRARTVDVRIIGQKGRGNILEPERGSVDRDRKGFILQSSLGRFRYRGRAMWEKPPPLRSLSGVSGKNVQKLETRIIRNRTAAFARRCWVSLLHVGVVTGGTSG